ESADGSRGAALGVALERLSPRLHEDDDEPGERLVQDDRRDDGKGRDDIGGEAAVQHSPQGLPEDGCACQNQADEPDEVRGTGMEWPEVGDATTDQEYERGDGEAVVPGRAEPGMAPDRPESV